MFDKEIIGTKRVYIAEFHHQLLLPWAIEHRTKGKPFFLLTLDHHTDTNKPFVHLLSAHSEVDVNLKIQEKIKKTDINNDDSMKKCIEELRNDQQIRAAIMLGIVSTCFVVSHMGSGDIPISNEEEAFIHDFQNAMFKSYMKKSSDVTDFPNSPSRPYTYGRPEDGIFIVGHDPTVSSVASPIDDDHLKKRLQILHEMSKSTGLFQSIFEEDYILDIDLDYFHTIKSTHPVNYSVFLNLIRNARAITIATEPWYVKDLREDELATSSCLLDDMRSLILEAGTTGRGLGRGLERSVIHVDD